MRPDLLARPGGTRRPARFTPDEIARHRLFTAREKLDLLERLRVEIAAHGPGTRIGFGPVDVDRAIAALREDVEGGRTARASDIRRP
jgi:hypothetical protein